MVAPQITIENTFSRALAVALDESRLRPDIARSINRIMQQWVSYAMAKIPVAQRTAIKARLEAPAVRAKFQQGVRRVGARGRESASARYQLLKHSVAAYIVWTTNYRRNGKPARQMSGQEFYATVGKYIASRQFSAGHHRGGLRPALNTFRVATGQAARLPRYRNTPGTAKKAGEREAVPTAEVENYAKAILEVAPNAFTDSLPEIELTVREWIARNLVERAQKAGLEARQL
jgi:hypothetical protein